MICIIWWFLFGLLLGLILFWLFDKWFRRTGESELEACHAECKRLRAELESSAEPVFDEAAWLAGASDYEFEPRVDGRDNLKIIEGIGPKIEQILNDAGLNKFSDVSNENPAKLASLLEAAGPRFKLANPNSWPTQAKLCAEGNWKDLKEYQDYLDGGVDLAERQDD